jgi:hypothetical protein
MGLLLPYPRRVNVFRKFACLKPSGGVQRALHSPGVIEEEWAYSTSGAWLQPQSLICKYRDLFLAHCKQHQTSVYQ